MNRKILSTLQFVAVVAACALIGYSLSRFPGGNVVPAWVPTAIGGGIGFLAFAISPLFSGLARRTEQDSSPRQKLSFKLMFVGGSIAAVGFLVGVLASSALGYVLFLIGWLAGAAGIILYRVTKRTS